MVSSAKTIPSFLADTRPPGPSLAMLESMFDDVKRMDKRQFIYQVKDLEELDVLMWPLLM